MDYLDPGPKAASSLSMVWGLVDWSVPTFDVREGAKASRVHDAVAQGAFIWGDLNGANTNKEVHIGAVGEEGVDAGPGVVIHDG